MWIDFNVQRTARRCSATGRALSPGEEFYSVIAPPEGDPASDLIERRDFCRDAWVGPPDDAVGWWVARVPDANRKPTLAPNAVLLELFDRWADDPHRAAARYVLALLLIRRRVLRLSGDGDHEPNEEILRVDCPERGAVYEVAVDTPDEQRAAEVQAELNTLLHDGPQPETASESPSVDDSTQQAA